MRLLFLTNLYPPASVGGYEQWCQEVAEGLRERDHDIAVVTSRYGRSTIQGTEPSWIYRHLHLEMDPTPLLNSVGFFVSRRSRERANLAYLRKVIESFAPHAVLVWGMWNLHRSLPALAEAIVPGHVAYYVGDYWPTLPSQYEFYWQTPGRHWATRLPKIVLGFAARRMLERDDRPSLRFAHALFPSAFLRDELRRMGVACQATEVIYGAVDTGLFPCRDIFRKEREHGALSLLYVGRLAPEKGVHTIIEALADLVNQRGMKRLQLTIVGNGPSDYEGYLRALACRQKADKHIAFLGPRSKDMLPGVYARADVLIFPSIWQEPFGRVLVEAMASGVAVVGTATGGAAEILHDGENALVFAPNDPSGLADQVMRLVEAPEMMGWLATNARRTALEKFDIGGMVTGIEAYLSTVAG